MAILNVDDFKAELTGGGARPNLFQVKLNFPAGIGTQIDTRTTGFLCKTAQLPASVMNVIEIPFRGRQLKVVGDRTFETWTVTVLNDTDFQVRNAMEAWMNLINAHSTNQGATNPADYMRNLQVQQLDKGGDVLKEYTFVDAFPTNIGAIDLSYDTVDTIEEFTVEFQYQYWTTETVT